MRNEIVKHAATSKRALLEFETLLPLLIPTDRMKAAALSSAVDPKSKIDADGRMRRSGAARRRIREGVLRAEWRSRAGVKRR